MTNLRAGRKADLVTNVSAIKKRHFTVIKIHKPNLWSIHQQPMLPKSRGESGDRMLRIRRHDIYFPSWRFPHRIAHPPRMQKK